jgi:hypothetical protein
MMKNLLLDYTLYAYDKDRSIYEIMEDIKNDCNDFDCSISLK